MTIWGPAHVDEGLAVVTELMHLAEDIGDHELALEGRQWRLIALLEQGDIPAVDEEIVAYNRQAEALRQPHYVSYAATWRALRAALDGRFGEAERFAQQALEIAQRAQNKNGLMFYTAQLFWLRWEQGRLHELEAVVADFADQYAMLPSWRCMLAVLYSELDREADTRRAFECFAAHDFSNLPQSWLWLIARRWLGPAWQSPSAHTGGTGSDRPRRQAPSARRRAARSGGKRRARSD